MSYFHLDVPWALVLLIPACVAVWWAAKTSRRRLVPWRARWSTGLRLTSVLLLVLSLAGLATQRRDDRLTVVFAVDVSRSVGGSGHPEVLHLLEGAAAARSEGDAIGLIAVGREAMVDTFPSSEAIGTSIQARPEPDATDLAAAVRLARGLFPPHQEARLVLVTDGVETRGDLEQAVAALPDGLDLVWAPLAGRGGADALVERVSVPARVEEGQPHRVRVVVRASRATRAVLHLDRGSVPVARAVVELEAGASQVFAFDQRAPDGSGALFYRARIEAPGDSTPENDTARALVSVSGRPSILLVDREPAALKSFAQVLEEAGMAVERGGPGFLPAEVRGLARFDAVVLSDVSTAYFSEAQIAALATWVEDLGGGLTMLGGPQSFGRGGWWQTPVEGVLPFSMEVKDRSYLPSVGIVLCLDKSGSMAGMGPSEGSGVKIEMAKSAAAGVVELLEPMDRLGVVAFDAAAKWVVPLSSAANQPAILSDLSKLRAGGGTDAYPALDLAYQALENAETRIKHVILLTDGQLSSRNHEGLAGAMRADGITVSTVGIGTDADRHTLESIATVGGGSFYHAASFDRLPRIFLRDAFRVARSWIVEETFQPRPVSLHPVLAGVDPAALPDLDGYVAASEKAQAQTLLASHRGDPLLGLWRVGLGKTVAFTSDAKARWAGRWLGWSGYGAFWSSLVRWTVRDPASGRLRVETSVDDGKLRLAADLLDDGGGFVNGALLTARVVGPGGERREVAFRQEGPGRYVGEVEASEEGPYLAAVVQEGGDGTSPKAGATAAAMVPYADELRSPSRAPDGLERLVESGRVRRVADPEDLVERRGLGGRIRFGLAPWLLALAALLLVAEVAVRKLVLPEGLWRRAPEEAPEERLTALQAARRRAVRGGGVERRGGVKRQGEAEPPRELAVPEGPTKPREDGSGEPGEPPEGYTSRLLKAKRRLRASTRDRPSTRR